MDFFTQRALDVAAHDRAAGPQAADWRLEIDIDVATPADPGPVTIEDRLALAYSNNVTPAIAKYYSWNSTNMTMTAFDGSISLSWETRGIIDQAESSARALEARIPTVRRRVAELMARLPGLKAEYEQTLRGLEGDPPLDASPQDVGLVAITKAGCERLIPAIEREIEKLLSELRSLKKGSANWSVLADLAGVIAGTRRPSDGLARDIGLEFAWQVCNPYLRAKREEERRVELEREGARAAAWEAGRAERERMAADLAEAEALRQADEARFEALGFEGLVSFLFCGNQPLSLDELKALASKWEGVPTFTEVLLNWPARPAPNTSHAARNELSALSDETGFDRRRNQAISRLKQFIAT